MSDEKGRLQKDGHQQVSTQAPVKLDFLHLIGDEKEINTFISKVADLGVVLCARFMQKNPGKAVGPEYFEREMVSILLRDALPTIKKFTKEQIISWKDKVEIKSIEKPAYTSEDYNKVSRVDDFLRSIVMLKEDLDISPTESLKSAIDVLKKKKNKEVEDSKLVLAFEQLYTALNGVVKPTETDLIVVGHFSVLAREVAAEKRTQDELIAFMQLLEQSVLSKPPLSKDVQVAMGLVIGLLFSGAVTLLAVAIGMEWAFMVEVLELAAEAIGGAAEASATVVGSTAGAAGAVGFFKGKHEHGLYDMAKERHDTAKVKYGTAKAKYDTAYDAALEEVETQI